MAGERAGGPVEVRVRALRGAIERGELFLEYQPKVDLASGRVTAVEALVRWHHAEAGIIPPAQFIPLAESCGLIRDLGAWTLREACRQWVAWKADMGASTPAMCVNVSASQFTPAFAVVASEIMAEARVGRGSLVIEVTETALMADITTTASVLTAIREAGARIAIDDFGTGYSSLTHLKRLPIDELKIDRSFVIGIAVDDADRAIVTGVCAIAHALGLSTIAEGVETQEQLAGISDAGCDWAQGFLFSPAVGPDEAARLCIGSRFGNLIHA